MRRKYLVIGLALVWTVGLIYFAPLHVEPVLIAFALGLVITALASGERVLGRQGLFAIEASELGGFEVAVSNPSSA